MGAESLVPSLGPNRFGFAFYHVPKSAGTSRSNVHSRVSWICLGNKLPRVGLIPMFLLSIKCHGEWCPCRLIESGFVLRR